MFMIARPDPLAMTVSSCASSPITPSLHHSSSPPPRWCFSTLGCPELSLSEVCELASQFRISGLELRSLWGSVDLASCATEHGFSPAEAMALLGRSGLQVIVAGSGFKLVGGDEKSRAELLRFCEWAESWNITYVRVFGGGSW